MKKKLLLLPIVLIGLYISLTSYSEGPAIWVSQNYSGATGTLGCNQSGCHTSAASTTLAIELDTAGGGPVTTYVPGGVYTIKMTGTNTSATSLPKFGFQLCAVKLAGAGTGAATAIGTMATTGTLPAGGTHTTLIGGIRIFEHGVAISLLASGSGGSGTTYVSSIQWTAPAAAGVGSAKFYGALNAVNNDGSTPGDKCNTANLVVPERVANITGATTVCVGADITLSDLTTGGVWSSGTMANATITTGGVVHGVAPGTSVISYNAGTSGTATYTITVVGPPSAGAISGSAAICAGSNHTLTNPTAPGGTWSTTTPSIITINSSGVVTGLSAGTATVSYAVTGTCGTSYASTNFTVNPVPLVGTISGLDSICVNWSVNLTVAGSGGTWGSTDNSIATVNSAGTVFGVSPGTTTITYTVTTPSCGSATALHTLLVKPPAAPIVITGPSSFCAGSVNSLTANTPGGFWESTNTSVASVGVTNGVVTGAGAGTATIIYRVFGYCSNDTAALPVTVNSAPVLGPVSGPAGICVGSTAVFHNTVAGGTWSVIGSAASILSAAGDSVTVSGITSGGAITLSYSATNSCGTATASRLVLVDDAIGAGTITGPLTPCPGVAVTYTYGGSVGSGSQMRWYSSNTSVATIGLSTGTGNTVVGASGTTNISLAIQNSCSYDSSFVAVTLLAAPNAGTLSGLSAVCQGASITLTPSVGGGTWTSGSPAVATVTGSGVVGGASAGTSMISYAISNLCGTAYATRAVSVNTIPSAGTLSGASTVCVGANTSLTPSVGGGTWTSGALGTATVNASGFVFGVAAGSVNITYTVSNGCGSAQVIKAMTVNPLPVSGTVSGPGNVCPGASISLSTTGSGGSWSSGNTARATVDGIGTVFGVGAGTVAISYSVTNGCGTASSFQTVLVNTAPTAGTISGSAFVCIGTSSSLSSTVAGGSWSSSNTSVVTISPTGVATGQSIGTATISYIATGTCGTDTAYYPISSGLSASAGTITGPSSVCVGASVTLVDLAGGGVWSSSNTGIATVNPATGRVTGVSPGTATITYFVSTSCGTASTVADITVIGLPSPGVISGESIICAGATAPLTESVTGGTWSSSTTSAATIDASGNVTGVNAGTTIIVYTVSNACGVTTALHTMVVDPLPVLAVISGSDTVCQGAVTALTSSATGGTWSVTNSAASVSSGGIVTGSGFGTDTVLYTTTAACGTLTGAHEITVLPTATAGIIGSGIVCLGDTVNYISLVTTGIWSVTTGHATINAATGSLIATSPGSDTISYTFSNTCGTVTASLAIEILTPADCATVGVHTIKQTGSIRMYPNPTDGLFTLEMPLQHADAFVTIMDVTGKVVASGTLTGGQTNLSFDLTSLSPGSYLVKIRAGDKTFRDKIVIW